MESSSREDLQLKDEKELKLLLSEADVPIFLKSINHWLALARTSSIPELESMYEKIGEDWKSLGELLKYKYHEIRKYIPEILPLASGTLSTVNAILVVKARPPKARERDKVTPCQVNICTMNAVQNLLISVNNDLEKGTADQELMEKFRQGWTVLFTSLIGLMLSIDVHSACSILDCLSAIGNEVFCRMRDKEQRQLQAFLVCYASNSEFTPTMRSKIGRCLAKLIEFPSIREDLKFFMDVFSLTKKNIEFGENTLKTSYAWTLGNLTDSLVEAHMNTGVENFERGFVRELLDTALKSTEVPVRGRYSACRACGNVFRWMKAEMIMCPENQSYLKKITQALTGMIGNGLDYKLRWNAAHAVGYALENEAFYHLMKEDITIPIIRTLAKWTAQSQNYKERTQCIVSLMKAKTRKIYGDFYAILWERTFLTAVRVPVEECDSADKFKTEVLLLVFHLVSILGVEDLESVGSIITENEEILLDLIAQTLDGIPLERLDEAIAAKENVSKLKKKVNRGMLGSSCLDTLTRMLCSVTRDDGDLFNDYSGSDVI